MYDHKWTKLKREEFGIAEVRALAKAQFSKSAFEARPGVTITEDKARENLPGDPTRSPLVMWNGKSGVMWILQGYGQRVCYRIPDLPREITFPDSKAVGGDATLYLISGAVERSVRTLPTGLREHTGEFAALYFSRSDITPAPTAFHFP